MKFLDVQSRNIGEEFVLELESLLNTNSKLGLVYKITYRRGFDKNPDSDSIRINTAKGEIVDSISIDMNIKSKPDQAEYFLPKIDTLRLHIG